MNSCNALLKAIDKYIQKADDDLINALKKAGYIRPKETITWAEGIEDAITEALEEESAMFFDYAGNALDIEEFAERIWPEIKLTDALAEKVTTIFAEQLRDFLPELIEPYLKRTDNALTLLSVTKKTTAWIESWSKELGSLMKLTSHTTIEDILKKDLESGVGIQQFILDIQESGIREERYRARRTAITEALRAHSVAQEEAIQQSPAVEEKEWVHSGSYRNVPRQNHVDMDGQIVKKEAAFTLIGADGETYYPMYPRDPILPPGESINCHCIHRGIVSEEILGLPLERRKELQAEAIAEMDDAWEKELNERNKAKAGIVVP